MSNKNIEIKLNLSAFASKSWSPSSLQTRACSCLLWPSKSPEGKRSKSPMRAGLPYDFLEDICLSLPSQLKNSIKFLITSLIMVVNLLLSLEHWQPCLSFFPFAPLLALSRPSLQFLRHVSNSVFVAAAWKGRDNLIAFSSPFWETKGSSLNVVNCSFLCTGMG